MSADLPGGPADQAPPRVQLLVRQQCHLCEAALAVVELVCAETGESYACVDIDTDPGLRARYTDEVPVTLVDGRPHDFWRVEPARLRAALTR